IPMRAVPASAGRLLIAAVLVVLGGWAIGECVAQDDKGGKKGGPEPAAKPTEKTYQIKMEGKPWKAVFNWLATETELPVIYNFVPTGSFSFAGSEKRRYTLPELVDIINTGLLSNEATQKYFIIRAGDKFTLVRADEKIDPSLLPKVAESDLATHGNTEVVVVTKQLTSMDADTVAPKFKKLKGDFAEYTPRPGNRLNIQPTVGNL